MQDISYATVLTALYVGYVRRAHDFKTMLKPGGLHHVVCLVQGSSYRCCYMEQIIAGANSMPCHHPSPHDQEQLQGAVPKE